MPVTLNSSYTKKLFYHILVFTIFIIGCNNSSESSYSHNSNSSFDNGEFCAEIHYYYSKTGTASTYTLLVDVEDGKLTKIHWSNGGWLDDSHFEPPDIENGTAEFTSYEGVRYSVNIIGNAGGCSTSNSSRDEDDLIQDRKNKSKRIQEEEEEKENKEEENRRKRQEEEEDNKQNNEDDIN